MEQGLAVCGSFPQEGTRNKTRSVCDDSPGRADRNTSWSHTLKPSTYFSGESSRFNVEILLFTFKINLASGRINCIWFVENSTLSNYVPFYSDGEAYMIVTSVYVFIPSLVSGLP